MIYSLRTLPFFRNDYVIIPPSRGEGRRRRMKNVVEQEGKEVSSFFSFLSLSLSFPWILHKVKIEERNMEYVINV